MVKIDLLKSERSKPRPVSSIRETHPLLRKASREGQSGRVEQVIEALNAYVQACRDAAWDRASVINRIGDIYLRLNRTGAANEQFAKAARCFADDGFYTKAIAIWKKILRNDPSVLEAHAALSDLHAKQRLLAESKGAVAPLTDEHTNHDR